MSGVGIAGSSTETLDPDNLIADSSEVRTDNSLLTAGSSLLRGAVVGRVTATGNLVECDLGAGDGSDVPIGIVVHDCDAAAAAVNCQFYTAGGFSDADILWHASFASQALKRVAFDRSGIKICF